MSPPPSLPRDPPSPVVGLRPADVVLSSCSLLLASSPACPGGVCGAASLTVTAVQDFIEDPDTQNIVEIEVTLK